MITMSIHLDFSLLAVISANVALGISHSSDSSVAVLGPSGAVQMRHKQHF